MGKTRKTTCVGVDVSSRDFKVAFHESERDVATFENTPEGIRTLVRFVRKHTTKARVLLESTGVYGLDLAIALHSASRIDVMYINPRAAKGHFVAGLVRAKTDIADARMLARMASYNVGHLWSPPSEHAQVMRCMLRRIRTLVEDRTREKNRLSAAKATKTTAPAVMEDIVGHISDLDLRISTLRTQAAEFTMSDADVALQIKLLVSIRGVGQNTAMEILAELRCLPADLTAKQLTAQAGLDPRVRQSGQFDAQRRISKMGSKRLRTALQYAAVNGVRHCPEIAACHARLVARGKHSQLANTAVSRKLLVCIHAMLSRNEPFNPTLFSRNATPVS